MTAITIFTSSNPQRLTKLWRREGVGYRKEPAGHMSAGMAERHEAPSPLALANLIEALQGDQAIGAGLCPHSVARVVAKAALNVDSGAISRTREHFDWPSGPGWMVLDYDPPKESPSLTLEQVRQALIQSCPELESAPMCAYYSGSSWIKDTRANQWVNQERGVHCWVLVDQAMDIPKAGERLANRLWLNGHGYYAVSRSGMLLERCLIDTAVWQPERLVFSARPECMDGLASERPPAMVWNDDAPPLNLRRALPEITSQEKSALVALKAQAKNSSTLLQEAAAAHDAWVEVRMRHLPVQATDAERQYVRADLMRAVRDHVLVAEFELTTQDGQQVRVADLLSEPEQWDGKRFCDPVEPEREDGDTRIAFARTLNVQTPFIYSHAHGGVRFTLGTPRESVTLLAGEEGVVAGRIAKRLAEAGVVYGRGPLLLVPRMGELKQPMLKGLIEASFRLHRCSSSGQTRVVACPDDMAHRVQAELSRHVRTLRGIVEYPVLRPDGKVLTTPGYDDESGLYYAPPSGEGRKMEALKDRTALKEAMSRVWAPFEKFCFRTDADRSMFLALLFTAMVRPALPTAPGFLIRAHMPGTGKTLLCRSVLAIVGIQPKEHLADTTQPEEFAKRIGMAVRGGEPVIVFDNLTGTIQNPELNAVLTSERAMIRRLGSNDPETPADTRSLWILNGNNVASTADMNRRLLPISLDAGVEHPELRRFDRCPVAEITKERERFQNDLLATMLTFHEAGAPIIEWATGLGSYNEWDRSVRQLILWLGREKALPFEAVDVASVVKANSADDPERLAFKAFLEAARAFHGSRHFTVRYLMNGPDGGFEPGPPERMNASQALMEAAAELAPTRQGHAFDTQRLGRLLSSKVGEICGGLRLEKGTKTHSGMRFSVVDADC